MTPDELRRIMPNARQRADEYADILTDVMERYEINTPMRQTAWLANVGHESLDLRYTEEIASGDAYEGRADLGNTERGDGRLFKGHGLMQLTGRGNHEKYAAYKGVSIDEVLSYLQTPDGAADVAGWFWTVFKSLNDEADRGDFLTVCKRINGVNRATGLPNGWPDRQARYDRAKRVLGA